MYLTRHEGLTKAAAYDKARREFYKHRHLEDLERRIAHEEALSTGAYFGMSANEVGMMHEDTAFENWKQWAIKEATAQRQAEEAMYTGSVEEEEAPGAETAVEVEDEETEEKPAVD